MATKATLERLTQLSRAATGKETKRPVAEILASEKLASQHYVPRASEQVPPPVSEPAEAAD